MPLTFRYAFLVVAVLLGTAACEEQYEANPLTDVGFLTLDGNVEPLSQWRGKTLVINVWATWCAPCRKEMADLQDLSERLDPERFQVLGVSVDKNPAMVREFLRENGITFARHIDPDKQVTRDILDVMSLPQTIIVDSQGIIRDRYIGLKDWKLVSSSELSQI